MRDALCSSESVEMTQIIIPLITIQILTPRLLLTVKDWWQMTGGVTQFFCFLGKDRIGGR